MKKLFSGKSKPVLILTIVIAAFIPISAGDNYFEVSKNLEIFSDIYKDLNLYYVDDVDPNTLMRTGIDAMLTSLDPYTNFISEADMEGYRLQTTGKYGGIGALIRKKGDYVAIVEPYENSPAYKAGLQAGDVILEVDGKSTKNRSVDEISTLLKGQHGTDIKLLITRPGVFDQKLFQLTRADITLENVPYYGLINEDVAYIKLDQFTEKAGKNVEDALRELRKKTTLKGVILDLRGNPGGLLTEAVNLSNVFISKNKLVVSTKGKMMEQEYKTLNQPLDTELPLAVLTSEGSASASEIVAGVIQEYDRGVIIGDRTFGKGLVQQTRSLSYKTKLKLTTAKYYLPSGRCIQSIDYFNRDLNGQASEIPDSLRRSFKTMGGRTVYDGAGVAPDVDVENKNYAPITLSLLQKDLIFDYATLYKNRTEQIGEPASFELSDTDYENFVAYLEDKEYDYSTKSEQLFEELVANTKDELYYDAVKEELETLKQRMYHDKQKDLHKFKPEIKELLEKEIVSRYYSASGRLEASFDEDRDIQKAIYLFNNIEEYNALLK